MSCTKITRSSNVTTIYAVTFARKNSRPQQRRQPSRLNRIPHIPPQHLHGPLSINPPLPLFLPRIQALQSSELIQPGPNVAILFILTTLPTRVPHFWPVLPEVGVLTLTSLVFLCVLCGESVLTLTSLHQTPTPNPPKPRTPRLLRRGGNPIGHPAHATPPAAAKPMRSSSAIPAQFRSTTAFGRAGSLVLRLFLAAGRSSTFG